MALPVDLLVGNPSVNFNLRNDPDVNLTMSRGNHGDDKINFQMCNWSGRLPALGDNVAIRDTTYGYTWSGYIGRVTPGGFFGNPAKIEGRGWRHTASDDGWDTTRIWEEGTPFSEVIMSAQSRLFHISSGIALPSGLAGFQLQEDTKDFMLQTPEDVLDYICDKLKYLATPLLWEAKQSIHSPMVEGSSLYVRFLDLAPRYQVMLTKNDDYSPSYDRDTVFNKGIVGWSPKLAQAYQIEAASELYRVIPQVRSKRVNATVDVSTSALALNMAKYLASRNNQFRPVNTTLTIHCDTPIEAQYPVVPSFTPNVPHHHVFSNYYIRVLNPTDGWGKYNVREHFISDMTYNFDSGELQLSLGDPIAYDTFPLQQSYQVNRINSALDSGIVSEPLRDADAVQVIGPDKAGDTPPTIGEVIPMGYLDQNGTFVSVTDITKPSVPFGAVVHPKVIPDYGVQANFGREADSIGTKGYIRVIPCKVWDWSLDFTPPAGSDTVPTDSITVQLYPTYPFTVGVNILATCTIAAAQGANGAIAASALQVFSQGGKIGVRVSSAAATAGAGFQVGIGGKKIYPDLGVTT